MSSCVCVPLPRPKQGRRPIRHEFHLAPSSAPMHSFCKCCQCIGITLFSVYFIYTYTFFLLFWYNYFFWNISVLTEVSLNICSRHFRWRRNIPNAKRQSTLSRRLLGVCGQAHHLASKHRRCKHRCIFILFFSNINIVEMADLWVKWVPGISSQGSYWMHVKRTCMNDDDYPYYVNHGHFAAQIHQGVSWCLMKPLTHWCLQAAY